MSDVDALNIDDEEVTRLAIIRKAGLFVDDPEEIPNRHHPIPTGMEPVRLLMDYNTSRTTGRKVRCSACAHQQAHNRGFVAEMPDGRPALIGINCGEKHFGDGEWDRMNADLRQQQDDVYFAARVEPAIQKIIASWENATRLRGAIRAFETNWSSISITFPDLFSLLHASCSKNEGYMDRYVRRMVQAVGRDGKPTQREQVETVRFGKVPAPEVFAARSAARLLDTATATLRTAKLKLERSGDTRSRRQAFAELSKGRKIAEDVAAQVRGYARNAETEWWSHAVRFCLADGAMEKLTLMHRTLQGPDTFGHHNVQAIIPRCDPSDIERADTLVRDWPSTS